jgi:hypothetical protein
VGEYQPDPDLLAYLADGMDRVDAAIRALVTGELRSMLPGFGERQEDAAAGLRGICDALREPEQHLAALEQEIAAAEAEAAQKRAQLDSGDFGTKVAARAWLASCGNEVAALTEKHRQQSDAIAGLRQSRDQARRRLEAATTERDALEVNASGPGLAFTAFGLGTVTFATFFLGFGRAVPVLLAGDRSHPFWDVSFRWLDELALRSGYRTDHLASDAEMARRAWDGIYAQASPPWAPRTGREVAGEMHRQGANMARKREAEQAGSMIEDHRGRPGPVRIPAR